MAGRGPAPKDPSKRARRNADPVPLKTVVVNPTNQPELPTLVIERDGELHEYQWPAVTLDWWEMWGQHPLAAGFSALEWSFLMDTARVHARHWLGDPRAAGELRLRVAKFGATPEDRQRLRLQFASKSDPEVASATRTATAKTAYGTLRAV